MHTFLIVIGIITFVIVVLIDYFAMGWVKPSLKNRTIYRIYEEKDCSYLQYRSRRLLFNFIPLWLDWTQVPDLFRDYESTLLMNGGVRYISDSNKEHLKGHAEKYPNVYDWLEKRDVLLAKSKEEYKAQEQAIKNRIKKDKETWPKVHLIRWFKHSK